jgi:hypothetical protein
MSLCVDSKFSISEHREKLLANQTSDEKWQSVKLFVATVMPRELMLACVDLDSVLLYHEHQDHYRLGRVLPLGRDLTWLLTGLGYRVVVLTARRPPYFKIQKLLRDNGVWFDVVTNVKPAADAYFDDKAFRVPKNWL